MPVSAGYVSREAVTNLWRNRLMTVAAILTVAVSLALVGSSLLLKQGASKATVQWQNGVNSLVFVNPNAPASQAKAIHTELMQSPYIKSCIFRSQAYDYNEAKLILPADELQATTLADYPSSFRCVLNDPSQAPAVYQEFNGKPGVFAVKYPGQQIKTMQSVIRILQWVFLSVAVVLLLSASVLILNTIRMAIFARRREVSVMKLVGATNWFIRLPFMAEGLIQGLLGAAVAVLVVLALYWGIGLDATKTAANTGSIIARCRSAGGRWPAPASWWRWSASWSVWLVRRSPCAASSTSDRPRRSPWPRWPLAALAVAGRRAPLNRSPSPCSPRPPARPGHLAHSGRTVARVALKSGTSRHRADRPTSTRSSPGWPARLAGARRCGSPPESARR